MTGICTPECGYVEHEAIAILQDLIAELRDWAEESLEHDGKVDWRLVGRRTNVLADRAEVRLKKLNDE